MGKDWGERFRNLASVCAVVMFLAGAAMAASDHWPAMAKDVIKLASRVSTVESAMRSMSVDQKQSLEIQLMTRLDAIDSRLKTMAAGDDYRDLRELRNTVEQRLGIVRSDLAVLRSSQ